MRDQLSKDALKVAEYLTKRVFQNNRERTVVSVEDIARDTGLSLNMVDFLVREGNVKVWAKLPRGWNWTPDPTEDKDHIMHVVVHPKKKSS